MHSKQKRVLLLSIVFAVVLVIGLLSYHHINNTNSEAKKSKADLDKYGGVSITYQTVKENPTKTEMADTVEKLKKRAEAFSDDSTVYQDGSNRICVGIPGIDDTEAVLQKLGDTGSICFVPGMNSDGVANIRELGSGEYELARTLVEIIADGDVIMDSTSISGAEESYQQSSNEVIEIQYVVELTLNDKGRNAFAEATEWAVSQKGLMNRIAIVYNGEVLSAPQVSTVIDEGKAIITGSKSLSEAKDLATIIRIGALPLELVVIGSDIDDAKK